MKRLSSFLLGLLLLLGCGGSGGHGGAVDIPPNAQPLLIYVSNQAPDLAPPDQVAANIADINLQLANEFKAAWGLTGTLVLADPPSRDVISLTYIRDSRQLGYDYQGFRLDNGRSCYVGMKQSLDGGTWQVTASHEVLEAVAQYYTGNDRICNPVAPYAYQAGTKNAEIQMVANFTFPAYWNEGAPPYDWLGLIKSPGVPAPGGL